MQYPVVISGAGILGCYISEALTLQGIDSVVLEKDIDEVEDSVRTITSVSYTHLTLPTKA